MYQLFYNGGEPSKLPNLPKRKTNDITWGNSIKEAHLLVNCCGLFSRMHESNIRLLLAMAEKKMTMHEAI